MLGKTEGKRRSRQQRLRWSDSITDSMNINLSKLWEIVKEREAWHTAAHGVAKEPKATELSIHSFTAPRQVLPRWLSGKESAASRRHGSNLWVGKMP